MLVIDCIERQLVVQATIWRQPGGDESRSEAGIMGGAELCVLRVG